MWEKGIILLLVPLGRLCNSQNVNSQEGITNCTCGRENYSERHIKEYKDDWEVYPNEIPHVALIRIDGQVACGGSIITSRHVLTSASCTLKKNKYSIQVVVGESDITRTDDTNYTMTLNVVEIKEHPDYNPITTTNDISIIVTKEPILFNWAVGPICLPKHPLNLTGRFAYAAGWGSLYVSKDPITYLRKVAFGLLKDSACAESFKKLDKKQMCIGMVGSNANVAYVKEFRTLQTDTGSAFFSPERETNLFIQTGVLSSKIHPYRHMSGKSAAQTAISPYIDWIQRVLDETQPLTGERLQTCSLLKENPPFY